LAKDGSDPICIAHIGLAVARGTKVPYQQKIRKTPQIAARHRRREKRRQFADWLGFEAVRRMPPLTRAKEQGMLHPTSLVSQNGSLKASLATRFRKSEVKI